MPAISADTMVLPRLPDPDPTARDRPVVSVTTAPSGLEAEGFPLGRRAGRAAEAAPIGGRRPGPPPPGRHVGTPAREPGAPDRKRE
jgi:hypothetical protein